jgi:hypothetical protein
LKFRAYAIREILFSNYFDEVGTIIMVDSCDYELLDEIVDLDRGLYTYVTGLSLPFQETHAEEED